MSINYANVTISGGVLTLNGTGVYRIETEGGAASDDIDSILGVSLHDVVELRPQVSGHWWTIIHAAANHILLMEGQNFTVSSMADKIMLRVENHGAANKLCEFIPRMHVPTT